MFGKTPRLSPFALQKQLLLAESELNRAQLVREWRTLADEAHTLTNRARTVGVMTAAAAALAAGLAAFRHKKSTPSPLKKNSWLQNLFRGAGLVSTLWSTFRRPRSDQPDT